MKVMTRLPLWQFFFAAFVFLSTAVIAFAQEKSAQDSTASATPTPEVIEYQLPYPGILPDSPLYIFKTARDRIVAFLISDPLKKAEFDLLQGNKRLNAGAILFKKGQDKEELAQSTISKGENYFESSIQNLQLAKKQGMNTDEMQKKLSLAVLKHKQVIEDLGNKASKSLAQRFEDLERRVGKLEQQVDLIKPHK